MSVSRLVPLGASFAVCLVAASASAEEFRSAYTIKYMGFPIASSEFVSRIEGETFSVKGSLASSGFASIFDTISGEVDVSGRIGDEKMKPSEYKLSYQTDAKKKSTVIRFAGNKVEDTLNDPPLRKRKNWVQVKNKHLRSVSDPLSATLIKADHPEEVCRRTLRLYDGQIRANLVLKPSATEDWRGVKAETCSVKFEPVAGYKKGKEAIEYLRDQSEITITFAELGTTDVYAPVRATIGTQIGTITVAARRIEGTN